MLRPQQQQLKILVDNIKSGSPIKDIFLFWVPGGGKSLAPSILSDLLTGNKKQIIVVPRNSLKYQMEDDYQSIYYETDKTCRVASNIGEPFRGCNSCVTTYQAIGANPEKWIQICEENNIMLILDEYHHLSSHGEWINIIQRMADLSFLRVMMTGTITRGDDTKLPLTPYIENDINFTNTESTKWIIYSRKQALIDKSILPFETILVDGSGSFIDLDGITRTFDRFGTDSNNLRCAFKSEYAEHLLDLSISHWLKHKKTYKYAKFIVVAPDIKTAKDYLSYLSGKGFRVGIATSDDNSNCRENIKRFKKIYTDFRAIDCLVSVAIAYEGLNVPEITHMVIMTLIRSVPWLEQCTGRSARNFEDKTTGYIFCPSDDKMLKALKCIDGGIIRSATGEPPEKQSPADPLEPTGPARTIEALSSEAHIDGIPLFSDFNQQPEIKESQSEKETRLRKEINTNINRIFANESPGNKKTKQRIFWLKIKLNLVNNGRDKTGKTITKHLNEFTVPELEKVALFSQTYK